MNEGDDLFERVQNFVADLAIPLSEKIKFDKRDRYDFFVIACYMSILEKAWAILALVDKQLGEQAFPVLRAQLDVFSDLTNLLADENYLQHLQLRQLESEKRRLAQAKSGNPYLATIAEHIDLEKQLSVVGQSIKKLERSGAKILEPAEKMKRAGLDLEYAALYPRLSDSVHGGLDSMINRHFREVGDDFEVVGFPSETKGDCIPVMQTTLDILLRASVLIHSHFKTGSSSVFEDKIFEH